MLEGVPVLGWFARLLAKRAKRPSTSVSITIHGDMVNSSVNINLPPRSELQLGSAEQTGSGVDSTEKHRIEDSYDD